MRKVGIFFAGAILALYLALPGIARAADCDLQQVASLKITTAPDGAITIPVMIEGKPYQFAFSLQADNVTAVTHQLAHKLNLKKHHLSYYHAYINNKRVKYIVDIPQMRIGMILGDKIKAQEWPRSFGNIDGAVGVLGYDVLGSYDVDLDLGAGTFKLFLENHCPAPVVYWSSQYWAIPFYTARYTAPDQSKTAVEDANDFFDAKLDGKTFRAWLNPENGDGQLDMKAAQEAFGLKAGDPHLVALSSFAYKLHYVGVRLATSCSYPFKQLSLQTMIIKNPDIVVSSNSPEHSCAIQHVAVPAMTHRVRHGVVMKEARPSLLLGIAQLRKLHIYIAWKHKTIYVTRSDADAAATSPASPASLTNAASSAAPASNAGNQ